LLTAQPGPPSFYKRPGLTMPVTLTALSIVYVD